MRKYREQTELFIIEGIKIIKEALYSNQNISKIFVLPNCLDNEEIKDVRLKCKKRNIPVFQVDEKIFKEITEVETTQGIIGVVKKKKYDINDMLNKHTLKIIILDEIQDPGNLGTIIRTAHACDYSCVFLSKNCVDLYNSKSIRATMGSLFHLPIINDVDLCKTISLLKKEGAVIFGAIAQNGKACYDINFDEKFAIIIGNESAGLSRISLDLMDIGISIPMPGKAESLNASVAASMLMYESIRKKT